MTVHLHCMCSFCIEPCVMSQGVTMTRFWCLLQVSGRCVVFLSSLNHTRLQHWTLGWKDINLKIGTYLLRPSKNLLQRGADPRAPLLWATFWILLSASHLLLWAKKSFSSTINPTLCCVQSPMSWCTLQYFPHNRSAALLQHKDVLQDFSAFLDNLMIKESWDIDQEI